MPLIKTTNQKEFLMNEETYATSLVAILFDKFGTDITDWEAESLEMEITDEYGEKLPQVNMDKIWGLITVLSTNQFYFDPFIFNATCQAFNDEESSFQMFSPVSVEGAAWAVTEAMMNDPDGGEFSQEVKSYIGVLLDQRGILEVPPILSMAEPSGNLTEGATQFADDVTFYEALWKVQKSNSESIMEYVQSRLTGLFTELQRLPLSSPVDMSTFKMPSLVRK
jgi:hypothetical protein